MYFGVATTTNKVRWIVFGVLALVFFVFIIACAVEFAKYRRDYDNCRKFGYWRTEFCEDHERDQVILVSILLVIWVIALITAPIPIILMWRTEKPVPLKEGPH